MSTPPLTAPKVAQPKPSPNRLTPGALIATLLAASVLLFSIWRFQTLTPFYESVAIAVLLGCTSSHPRSMLARLLQREPLVTVAMLSYSLYIWQELFLVPHWRVLTPFMFALLFATAYASYHLIERPCIALAKRHRVQQSWIGKPPCNPVSDREPIT